MVRRKQKRREKTGPIGCLEAQKMIEPFLGGKLTDEELRHFLDHMEHCPDCYDELNVFYTVYSALREDGNEKGSPAALEETIARSRTYLKRKKRYQRFSLLAGAAGMALLLFVGVRAFFPEASFNAPAMRETVVRVIGHSPREVSEPLTEPSSGEEISETETSFTGIKETP